MAAAQERGRGLPDEAHAHAAAVAAVGASPAVLHRLLAGMTAEEAWRRLAAGTHPADPGRRHRQRAASHPPVAVAEACARCGVRVLLPGDPGYLAFLDQRERPAVLFAQGDVGDIDDRLRVAVVGTRSPSGAGTRTAWRLGRELAEAGVVVVSGLARGIDTAAHRGALAGGGPPVMGVLGAAHDGAVGPDAAELHRQVAGAGLLLGEVPPGAPGSRWMFAVRNRLMAAAAHVVVVVESHAQGGSLHTVEAARRLGVPVAVPHPAGGLAASAGTRALLGRGLATEVAGAPEVVALARAGDRPATMAQRLPLEPAAKSFSPNAAPSAVASRSGASGPPPQRDTGPPRGHCPAPDADADAVAVQCVLGPVPADLAVVAARARLPVGRTALALHALHGAGLAAQEHGWWSRA